MDEPRVDEGDGGDEGSNDYDVGEAFGEHHIEYWVYDGRRLVPASPEYAERLRDLEATDRLELWKGRVRQQRRWRVWRQSWVALTQWLGAHVGQVPYHLRRSAGQ